MKKAFTLIELIVTISIIVLFASLTIPRYNDFNQQSKLRREAENFTQVLELAKKKATASDLNGLACPDFNGYRVNLAAASYSLSVFCNGGYQSIQSYNFATNISTTLGTGNFDFSPGGLNTNININTVRLKNTVIGQCVNISISQIGIMSISQIFSAGC